MPGIGLECCRVLQMDSWRLRQAVETHGLAQRFAAAGSLAAPGLPAGLEGSGAGGLLLQLPRVAELLPPAALARCSRYCIICPQSCAEGGVTPAGFLFEWGSSKDALPSGLCLRAASPTHPCLPECAEVLGCESPPSEGERGRAAGEGGWGS